MSYAYTKEKWSVFCFFLIEVFTAYAAETDAGAAHACVGSAICSDFSLFYAIFSDIVVTYFSSTARICPWWFVFRFVSSHNKLRNMKWQLMLFIPSPNKFPFIFFCLMMLLNGVIFFVVCLGHECTVQSICEHTFHVRSLKFTTPNNTLFKQRHCLRFVRNEHLEGHAKWRLIQNHNKYRNTFNVMGWQIKKTAFWWTNFI